MSRPAAPIPRVLRVGIVQDGAVTHERLIPVGESATIGTDADCTFCLSAPGLPQRQSLFVARRGRYHLCIPEQAELLIKRSAATERHSGVTRIVLDEADRGKVQLGGVSVLFQFIEAPPAPVQALRGSFRPRLIDEDDPVFLGILSLCSAAAAAMMIYVSSLPMPEMLSFDEAQEYIVHNIQLSELTIADPEPTPAEDALAMEDGAPQDTPAPEPEPEPAPEVAEVTPESGGDAGLSPAEREIQRALALRERKEQVVSQSAMLQQLIRTRGDGTSVFQGEDAASERWDQELANATGSGGLAAAGGGSMRAGTDQAALGDGRIGSDLGSGGGGGPGGIGTGGGPPPVVPAPVAEMGPISAPEEVAPTLQSALRAYSRQIRSCYEQRLKEIPSLEGRLVLGLVVEGGSVVEAYISENTTRDSELERCVVRRASSWKLRNVEDAEATMPFSLTPG